MGLRAPLGVISDDGIFSTTIQPPYSLLKMDLQPATVGLRAPESDDDIFSTTIQSTKDDSLSYHPGCAGRAARGAGL